MPNGEWLQAHRALLVTSLFIAIVGFFTAFIANANQSTPGFVDTSNVSSDSNNFLYWYCVTLMFVFLNAQLTSLENCHFGVGR